MRFMLRLVRQSWRLRFEQCGTSGVAVHSRVAVVARFPQSVVSHCHVPYHLRPILSSIARNPPSLGTRLALLVELAPAMKARLRQLDFRACTGEGTHVMDAVADRY